MKDEKTALEKANECLKIQGTDGNWDVSEYMLGMFNGMELVVSIMEDRDVNYRTLPSKEAK